jgi:DNA-binding XRE family transcriptional regulator
MTVQDVWTGQDLKAWRARHELTQSQAGFVLGARKETIIQWEKLERIERRLWLACLYLDEHPEMLHELTRI